MTSGNGTAAMTDPAVKIANELREHVATLDETLLVLWEQVDRVETDRERFANALHDLTGERVPKAGKRKANVPAAPKKSHRDTNDWTVSDEKVDQVWEQIRAWAKKHGPDKPFTQTELDKLAPGLSSESIRRGIVVLREREKIRLVGRTRGGGKSYAIMPDAEAA